MAQTSTMSRTQRRMARTESATITAAEDLFLGRSFGGTRIEDVAGVARLGRHDQTQATARGAWLACPTRPPGGTPCAVLR